MRGAVETREKVPASRTSLFILDELGGGGGGSRTRAHLQTLTGWPCSQFVVLCSAPECSPVLETCWRRRPYNVAFAAAAPACSLRGVRPAALVGCESISLACLDMTLSAGSRL